MSGKWPARPLLTDAVEKVRCILLTRNNRIIGVNFLNRTCTLGAHFESMLLREPPKIFFRQHRPKPVIVAALELYYSLCNQSGFS